MKPQKSLHRVTVLRTLFGVSLDTLAHDLTRLFTPVSPSTLSRIERGSEPDIEVETALKCYFRTRTIDAVRGFIPVRDLLGALRPLLYNEAQQNG